MKLTALLAVIVAAGLALAGCTLNTPSAAQNTPPPPTGGTSWVPVTGLVTSRTPPPPPVAPASYTVATYEFPPPKGSQGGGTGITMPVPFGWTKTPNGDKTDYRDPTGQLLVQVELAHPSATTSTTAPTDDSAFDVGVMQEREQATRWEYADYHLISLVPAVLGPENLVGAQWQFTFVNYGVTRLVIVSGTDFYGVGTFGTTYVSGPVQYGALVTAIADQERAFHIAG